MPKLTIDNKQIEVQTGATVLDAARKAGIDIPTLCYMDGCDAQTSCLVCVVRVNGRDKLVPACATRAEGEMVVESEAEDVRVARRTALELLLGDHVGDCTGPCQSVCPAHMDIPGMIRHISAGRMKDAIATVKDRIALPAALGRICPEICEKGCRRASYDASVSICMLKRFVADADLASETPYLPPCKPSTGKKVAIVGSGPTGLAGAYYLLQEGHDCTVFDENARPGGMLRYGVTPDRLPNAVLDAEIGLIERLGVRFEMESHVGSVEQLRGDFDAVLIAVGHIDKDKAARLGLQMSGRGLAVDKSSFMTTVHGVFAAGSAVSPSRFAVRAVADGRSAALAISTYLDGKPIRHEEKPFSVHIGKLHGDELSIFVEGANPAGRTGSSSGLAESEAVDESLRCVRCDCSGVASCKLRRYAVEYGANPSRYKGERGLVTREQTHPVVIHEPGKCISCGLCVQITAKAGEPMGLTFIGRGFTVATAVPFGGKLSDGLAKVAEECVRACPTGALELRKADR